MKSTLFAWIGNKDLDSARNDGTQGLGAICQAVTDRQFDDIVLLSDYPETKTSPYTKWLSGKGAKNIQIIPANLGGNPTDYRAIYLNAKEGVQGYLNSNKGKCDLTFHLSPGTPQMATTWVILAN